MKLLSATILVALIAAAACKKTPNTKVAAPADRSDGSDRAVKRQPVERADQDPVKPASGDGTPTFSAVYFEFDSTTLSERGRAELQELAGWLESNPTANITIEGHADERGTDEYNVALGQRRAQVIKDYLARLGVKPARLGTISFGEERPASSGGDERAWAEDRRGEIVPTR